MVIADAKFVLGADHSERLHSADLGLLDLEIARKNGPDSGEKHLLACSHVRSAANHGYQFARTVIDLGNVEMIRIRMHHAFLHLRNNDLRTQFLFLGNRIHLNAYGCHGIRYLLRRKTALEIFLQPTVRKFHICSIFYFQCYPAMSSGLKREAANSFLSKTLRSSTPSPIPMNLIGIFI